MFLFDKDLDSRPALSILFRWLFGLIAFCAAILALAYLYQFLRLELL